MDKPVRPFLCAIFRSNAKCSVGSSLIGGIKGSKEWIELAEEREIKWWITSALESNIGLNAISQFVATTGNTMFQGLGTGKLYTNNISSPLSVEGDEIFYKQDLNWDLSGL